MVPTYIKLSQDANPALFARQISTAAERYYPDILNAEEASHTYYLESIGSMHLGFGTAAEKRRHRIFQLATIAFFILVMIQFVIASVLLLSTMVIFQQIHFMKNSQLGFDAEALLVIPTQDTGMGQVLAKDYEVDKNEFARCPAVHSTTAHLRAPGRIEHKTSGSDQHISNIFIHLFCFGSDHQKVLIINKL